MSDTTKQLPADDTPAIDAGQEPEQLESGEDLAAKALQAANLRTGAMSDDDEVAASDEIAETLNYLQSIIERNAEELTRLKNQLKEKRESLSSVFENDTQLAEAEEQAKQISTQVKERKAQINNSSQASQLKTQIAELREQQKEIEETLSGHLLNYYTLTNSTSFDTSDGDQWEFNIKAKVKSRKK